MWFFVDIIDKKIKGKWWDRWWCVYIMHIKRYVIKTYTELGRCYDTWCCVHAAYEDNYI
jgi:hypothetical protein